MTRFPQGRRDVAARNDVAIRNEVADRLMLLGPGAQASRGPKGDPGHATYASRYFHLKVASAIEKVAADQIAMIPI